MRERNKVGRRKRDRSVGRNKMRRRTKRRSIKGIQKPKKKQDAFSE